MLLNRRQWIIGAGAALAGPIVPAFAWELPGPDTVLPDLTSAQIVEDLAFLRTQWAPLDKSFTAAQRAAFEGFVTGAMARAATSSAKDLVLDVMRAVAIPRNGHTTPMVGRLLDALPIRLWWFSDGLYIVSTAQGFDDILGARIENFGNLTADKSLALVAPYISGTDQRIRSLSASYLTSPMVLSRIGALAEKGDVPLTLRFPTGEVKTVNLGKVITPDPGDLREPVFYGSSALIPDDKDKPGRWVHVLDGLNHRSPGYGRPAPMAVRWIGSSEKVFYVRSNFLHSEGKDRLADDLFGVLQDEVVPKQPKFVVIDLRLNNGGNFFEAMLFTQALPKLIPPNGHIFVLVGRATFSAALVTVAMLKRSGPDNVTLIGEPMGDRGYFWAEPDVKILPNSKIPVFYSTKFEDFEQGCSGNADCYWPAAVFAHGTISIEPEVEIDVSFADYAAGRDPVLDAALKRAE